MAESVSVDRQKLDNIVDAVNEKTGNTSQMNLDSIPNAVRSISGTATNNSLGITSAKVGQIAKIKAIDENGKPTEWEPVNIISDNELTSNTTYSSMKIYETFCPPMNISGNIVTCYPAGDYPIDIMTITEPIQEGNGNPSPENVRNIRGFTNAKICQMSENKYNSNNLQGENCVTISYIKNGFRLTKTNSTQYASAKIINIYMKKGEIYKVRGTITSSDTSSPYMLMSVIQPDGNYKGPIYDNGSGSYICDKTGEYNIRIYVNFKESSIGDYTDFTNITISTENPYNEYNIDFKRSIYNAEYHWNSGKLILKSEIISLKNKSISTYSYNGNNGVVIYNALSQRLTRANGLCTHGTLSGPNRPVPEWGSWIWAGVNDTSIYWIDILDVLKISFEVFRDEWLPNNDVLIVYELIDPIIIDIDSFSIKNIGGGNTFISDIGATGVVGREDPSHIFNKIYNNQNNMINAYNRGVEDA